MTELTYLNDTLAEISPELNQDSDWTIILDVEKHNGTDYITIGYFGQEENVMLTKAEAEHLRSYLNKILK